MASDRDTEQTRLRRKRELKQRGTNAMTTKDQPSIAAETLRASRDYFARLSASIAELPSLEAQLAWLGDFATRDLSQAPEVERSKWEIEALCAATGRPGMLILDEKAAISSGSFAPQLSRQQVGTFQAELGKCLAALAKHGARYEFPVPLYNGLQRTPGRGRAALFHSGNDRLGNFVGAFVAVLTGAGDSLAFCEHCGNPFSRSRAWMRFCDRQCQNFVAVKRHREKDPVAAADRRHESYAKKQRRRIGPNVRVARRRPRRDAAN